MSQAGSQQVDVPASVEQLVRSKLSAALGGQRGMVEAALPTLAFTLTWVSSHQLRPALVASVGLASALLAIRLVQRQTPQFVLNSMFGIGIGALIAMRTGDAKDVFLPGIISNAVYGTVMLFSVMIGWPLVGFLIGSVTGDVTAWHRDRPVVRLCSRLTLVLAVPCILRVVVQYPLFVADRVGWLGVAKITMGWPLQVAALAAMVYLLSRNATPVDAADPPDLAPGRA
ncbi:DUF3159 domain-containing protein [soil metagenome]